MSFTTAIFLFVAFPLSFITYGGIHLFCNKLSISRIGRFLEKLRLKELTLIGISLVFYACNRIWDAPSLCLYILAVYFFGRLIECSRQKNLVFLEAPAEAEPSFENLSMKMVSLSKTSLIVGIAGLLLCLFTFKYLNFSIRTINQILHVGIAERSILSPLGISFITFSAISYLADIYRGKASGQSLIDCAVYITFFPKIVSGPIVLWQDFQPQLHTRCISVETCVSGINRIMIGFAKKLILADTFGQAISDLQAASQAGGIDAISAWGGVLLYMLQIYYDFAGYSDIALGLSKLFGFEFKENFNFPYRSKSISEFWRRWHISLGTWFREYVYFPLGGSKKGIKRTLWNLAIVFTLTGIWHGASWNYIIWGAINGGFVLLERVISDKPFYQRIPNALKWLGTMFIVMMFWEMFRYQSIGDFISWLNIMLGKTTFPSITMTWQYYFDFRLVFLIVTAIIGATVIGSPRIIQGWKKLSATKIGFIVQELTLLLLFVIAVLCMINSTYSPFIYFQY